MKSEDALIEFIVSQEGAKNELGTFLYIGQRDFKIEVKYLKNWISSANTRAASKSWSVFQQDFDWLMDEIDNGKKWKGCVCDWMV